jgi:hypothetical protein
MEIESDSKEKLLDVMKLLRLTQKNVHRSKNVGYYDYHYGITNNTL